MFRPRIPPTHDLHCVISPSIKETHTLIHTRVELSLKSLSGRRYPINQLSFRNNYSFFEDGENRSFSPAGLPRSPTICPLSAGVTVLLPPQRGFSLCSQNPSCFPSLGGPRGTAAGETRASEGDREIKEGGQRGSELKKRERGIKALKTSQQRFPLSLCTVLQSDPTGNQGTAGEPGAVARDRVPARGTGASVASCHLGWSIRRSIIMLPPPWKSRRVSLKVLTCLAQAD